MKPIAREAKLLRGRRVIENGQDFLNCICEIRPYAAAVVTFI